MTGIETKSLSEETGIRHALKRYIGPYGAIMILLGGALIMATYLEEFLWIVLMVVVVAAAGIYFMARHKTTA